MTSPGAEQRGLTVAATSGCMSSVQTSAHLHMPVYHDRTGDRCYDGQSIVLHCNIILFFCALEVQWLCSLYIFSFISCLRWQRSEQGDHAWRKQSIRACRREPGPIRTLSYIKFRPPQEPFPESGPNIGCVHSTSICKQHIWSVCPTCLYQDGVLYKLQLSPAKTPDQTSVTACTVTHCLPHSICKGASSQKGSRAGLILHRVAN